MEKAQSLRPVRARGNVLFCYSGILLFCMTSAWAVSEDFQCGIYVIFRMVQRKLSVIHAGKNVQAASGQRSVNVNCRFQHGRRFFPAHKDECPCTAVYCRGFECVQSIGLQECNHVILRYAAGVPVIILKELRPDSQRPELESGKPSAADQAIAAAECRPDHGVGEPGGNDQCAFDQREAADVPPLCQHLEQDLPAQG